MPGCAVGIFYEGDEFEKYALPAHAQLFAQVLTGKVVVLSIGVDALYTLLRKEIAKERMRRLEDVPLALIGLVQHTVGAEGVPHGVLVRVGFTRYPIIYQEGAMVGGENLQGI